MPECNAKSVAILVQRHGNQAFNILWQQYRDYCITSKDILESEEENKPFKSLS